MGGSVRSGFSTTVADSALVPQVGQNDNFNSAGSTSGGFGTGLQEGFKASSTQESENGSLSCFREDVRCKEFQNGPLISCVPHGLKHLGSISILS